MRLYHRFAIPFLCGLSVLLAGCSTLTASSEPPVKTIVLNTEGIPENLTIYLNEEPQSQTTNNGEIKLSVPENQVNAIKVINEVPPITYQTEIPQESKEPATLKIDPLENDELNQQVANFLKDYFNAVNQKKNALSFLSENSVFDSKKIYKYSYKSAVLYPESFKLSTINGKPELIFLVDAVDQKDSSYTRTYEFRLLWEAGGWKIFHQRILYEVYDGKVIYENEEGTYQAKQSPGPHDIKLSF